MRIFTPWLLLLGLPLLQPPSSSGLKIAFRYAIDGMPSDRVEYRDQDRGRTEYRNSTGGSKRRWDGSTDVRYGPRLAVIIRCDLGQEFELNLDAGEYQAAPYPPKPLSKAQAEALGLKPLQFVASDKPTLRIETTTLDTGERKEFFGHTARHVITTEKQIPLEGSKSIAQQMVKDGWYIDLDTRISCAWKRPLGKPAHVHAFLTAGNAPIEKREFVDKGEPETGFAIEQKITTKEAMMLSDGTKKDRTSVQEMRVTQLVESPLDPGLFTVPTGFRQVKQIDRDPPPNSPNPWSMAWNRFKASVARLFR
jgi:hypothetical protein